MRSWSVSAAIATIVVVVASLFAAPAYGLPVADPGFGSNGVIGGYGSATGEFVQPLGMASDSAGNLYVADSRNHRVQVFDARGAFLRAWGTQGTAAGQFGSSGPQDVSVGDDNLVYVADPDNARIEVFDTSGHFRRSIGSAGSGDGQLGQPSAVAAAADGTVFVSDHSNNRIEAFDGDGTYLRQWSTAFPGGLAVGRDGNIWVITGDANGPLVKKFTPAGNLLLQFGSYGFGDGQFNLMRDLAIGGDNSVYVVDDQNNQNPQSTQSRTEVFSPSGQYLGKFDVRSYEAPLGMRPAGIGTDCDGNVYIDDEHNEISRFHDGQAACGLTVTDTGDTSDADPGDHLCADSDGMCTLRAAIQEVNASASATPTKIGFAIPVTSGDTVPVITPASALPIVTAPVDIDATSQPGTGRERVVLGTRAGRLGFAGLDLQGAGSSVKGLIVAGFRGAGLAVGGAGPDTVGQSVFSGNDIGIDVSAPNVTLDGLGVHSNGNPDGATEFEKSVQGTSLTPAQAQPQLVALGAGIVGRSGASGLTITGSVIGGLLAADGASPAATNQSTGVLLAPSTAALDGVEIGSSSSQNIFRGNGLGVVVAAPSAAVTGLTVAGDNFGAEPNGAAPLSPVSNGVGVLLSGNVSHAQLGMAGARNTFVASGIAMMALGTGVRALRVQFNLVGTNSGLGNLLSSPGEHAALGRHNMFGLVLGDVSGAVVGGPTGTQNAFVGDAVGVLISGSTSRLNVIEGNTFGRFGTPAGRLNERPSGEYGALEGIVASGGGANMIGTEGHGNRFSGAVVGAFLADEDSDILSANTISNSLYGLVLDDVEHTSVGNATAATSNVFTDNWIGILQGQRELTGGEQRSIKLASAPADAGDRSAGFASGLSSGPLDVADALTTANVGAKAVTIAEHKGTPSSFSARYGRNFIGTTKAQQGGHGNYLGLVLAGDVRRALVGVGGGGPNVIADNHAAGVAMLGLAGHAPSGVSLRGNAIYHNASAADALIPATRGLGIDLVDERGGAPIFGPTANDPEDADSGPNGLQNYPVFTDVSRTSNGLLRYAMTLESSPGDDFDVEITSSPTCSPTGYGEGQHLLAVLKVETGSSGAATAAVEPGLRLGRAAVGTRVPRGDHYLTATATGPDGSTSEFSPCVRIASTTPPVGLLPLDTGVSSTGLSSVQVFNAGAYEVREVKLDVAGFTSHLAGRNAATSTANGTIASSSVRIAPHHGRAVTLRLTKAGRALLKRRHELTVVARVTAVRGRHRITATRSYVIYAPHR